VVAASGGVGVAVVDDKGALRVVVVDVAVVVVAKVLLPQARVDLPEENKVSNFFFSSSSSSPFSDCSFSFTTLLTGMS
jgi:hypothetical protein